MKNLFRTSLVITIKIANKEDQNEHLSRQPFTEKGGNYKFLNCPLTHVND